VRHFLFAAEIQAALGDPPPGGALHRWYLDEGVFMSSVAEKEGVLAALRRTLAPLLNLRKKHRVGPGPAPSLLAAAAPLRLEGARRF